MTRAKVSYSAITCISCQTKFIPRRKDQKFCSRICKEHDAGMKLKIKTAATKEKRQLAKDLKFENSSFGEYIFGQCCRAGTVQILERHNLETLLELYEIYKSRIKYSGLIEGKCGTDFHISHIYPVSNKEFLGLLHPKNLVIAGASYNLSRKNKIPDIDSEWKIKVSSLDTAYLVKTGATKAQVFKLLRNLLGLDLYRSFIEAAKLRNSKKVRLVKRLIKLGYDSKFLFNLETSELEELVFESTKTPPRKPSLKPASLALVLKLELERTNNTNSVLYDWIAYLAHKSHKYNNAPIDINRDFEEFVYRAAQDLLHNSTGNLIHGDNHLPSHLHISRELDPKSLATQVH